MWSKIATQWCRTMHSAVMWPVNGRYVCPRCLREYAVDWPVRPAQCMLTSKFGVRTPAREPVRIRDVPVAVAAMAREETLVTAPASQGVDTPAPASTGIYVGGLSRRIQPVPFF